MPHRADRRDPALVDQHGIFNSAYDELEGRWYRLPSSLKFQSRGILSEASEVGTAAVLSSQEDGLPRAGQAGFLKALFPSASHSLPTIPPPMHSVYPEHEA